MLAITLLCAYAGFSVVSKHYIGSPTLLSPAEVRDVQPRYGSIAGGTLLTVSGSDFVSDFYSGSASVSVGGLPCTMNWYGLRRCTNRHDALPWLNELQG